MRKRRPLGATGYFLMGGACLLIAVVLAMGARHVVHLLPVVILGVPGVVLTFRAPVFGVRYGPDGLRYSGLLNARSHAWTDNREVRLAVVSGAVYSSDVPELVLASGGADQLHMLSGHSFGRARNRRVVRLVAELEAARAAAS
ncbi:MULTISPECIES: hypothetical protein [unclassified Streptomyces]|uniref:hypothetical protein n=1 Tax=Streptomyces sp. NPDC055082 TaxID=3365718 RepID=UPI0037CFC453